METPEDSSRSFQRPLTLGAEEDQEQQHGQNAVVSGAGEEGGEKKGLVLSGLAQGGLDRGEIPEGQVAESKRAQEEPAQSTLPQRAAGVGKEGEEKEEEMEERRDGDGASSSEDDMIDQKRGQSRSDQPQPQREAAIPEGSRNQAAGTRLADQSYSHTIFTHSQLCDLKRLFQQTHYPCLRARKELAQCIGVDEYAVLNWFRIRRAIFKRDMSQIMLCELPPLPESDDSP